MVIRVTKGHIVWLPKWDYPLIKRVGKISLMDILSALMNIVGLAHRLFTTTEGLTLLIACVTAWAAWESRKMAKISQRQFEAGNRPLLGMSGVRADPNTGYSLIITNHGRVITKHRIRKMLVDGSSMIPKEQSAEEFITFPGDSTNIFLGKRARNGSTIEFQIEYENADTGMPKYITEQTFSLHGNTTLIVHSHST